MIQVNKLEDSSRSNAVQFARPARPPHLTVARSSQPRLSYTKPSTQDLAHFQRMHEWMTTMPTRIESQSPAMYRMTAFVVVHIESY